MHALSTNRGMHVSSIGLTTNFCISLEVHLVIYVHVKALHYYITLRYRHEEALRIFAHFTRKRIYAADDEMCF